MDKKPKLLSSTSNLLERFARVGLHQHGEHLEGQRDRGVGGCLLVGLLQLHGGRGKDVNGALVVVVGRLDHGRADVEGPGPAVSRHFSLAVHGSQLLIVRRPRVHFAPSTSL